VHAASIKAFTPKLHGYIVYQ